MMPNLRNPGFKLFWILGYLLVECVKIQLSKLKIHFLRCSFSYTIVSADTNLCIILLLEINPIFLTIYYKINCVLQSMPFHVFLLCITFGQRSKYNST